MQVALIAALCCTAPTWLMVIVMVVVACCCCTLYQLALMLALTFAPCILTFASCACGVSLSTGANIPLAQVVVVTSCNLRRWCLFIQPLAQLVHLHTWWYHPLQLALVVLSYPATDVNTALALSNLHCVVVASGGGSCIWR